MDTSKLDMKRIWIFLGFAFGIAWLTALVIHFTGDLTNSPQIAPNITLALVLLATTYMGAPALANVLTRLITHEGFHNVGLWPHFKKGWPLWIAGWVLPAVFTVLGAALFFALFPQYFGGLEQIRAQVEATGVKLPMSLELLILLQVIGAILISPIANSLATFGEEFGWRAYLMPKLLPLGKRPTALIMGVIWGAWHWPVIAMGYEYGFKYWGFPWVGMLLFLVFTFAGGTLLMWLTLKGRSIWPAVIGHAAMNGIAALPVAFIAGQPPALLGPLVVGIIGMVAYLGFALVLFFHPTALNPEFPTSLDIEQPAPLAEQLAEA